MLQWSAATGADRLRSVGRSPVSVCFLVWPRHALQTVCIRLHCILVLFEGRRVRHINFQTSSRTRNWLNRECWEFTFLFVCVYTCTAWLLNFLCLIYFVRLVLLQTKPYQALADLQSHVGRDQSHLSRWTVPRRHIPHYQGRRRRVLEKVFWRKVSLSSFLLVSRCICQIRCDLSSLSLELQSIKTLCHGEMRFLSSI